MSSEEASALIYAGKAGMPVRGNSFVFNRFLAPGAVRHVCPLTAEGMLVSPIADWRNEVRPFFRNPFFIRGGHVAPGEIDW